MKSVLYVWDVCQKSLPIVRKDRLVADFLSV